MNYFRLQRVVNRQSRNIRSIAPLLVSCVLIAAGFLMMPLLRIVVGIIAVLFLPGFFATFIVFPYHRPMIKGVENVASPPVLDVVERGTLAVLLSMVISSVVILVLYPLNAILPGEAGLAPWQLVVSIGMVNIVVGVISVMRLR